MGKRSQARLRWAKRHDAPPMGPRPVRVWICADCRKPGVTLIRCADGRQRCVTCKAGFERAAQSVVLTG